MAGKRVVRKQVAKKQSAKKQVAKQSAKKQVSRAKSTVETAASGKGAPSSASSQKKAFVRKAKPATTAARKRLATSASAKAPRPVFYRLNTLLHTLRVISSYEDQLCTLLHALKQEGNTPPALAVELRDLLEEMPTTEYHEEIEALRDELAAPVTTKRRATSR